MAGTSPVEEVEGPVLAEEMEWLVGRFIGKFLWARRSPLDSSSPGHLLWEQLRRRQWTTGPLMASVLQSGAEMGCACRAQTGSVAGALVYGFKLP